MKDWERDTLLVAQVEHLRKEVEILANRYAELERDVRAARLADIDRLEADARRERELDGVRIELAEVQRRQAEIDKLLDDATSSLTVLREP